MSKISKKFVSVALTATTALWASGAFMLVPVASAQSTDTVQAQIAALLAQITQLQAQLGTARSTTPAAAATFTRDLTVGSRGTDVTALQQVLINGGYLNISAPTGYFGAATKKAVAAWQRANGVSPASGYFGSKSRAAYTASVVAATPITGVVTTPVTGTATSPVVVVPTSGLSVSVAADNPPAGSLISSSASAAARVPVLKVALTAGTAGGITVTDVKFRKNVGVLSDSSISGAYIEENGQVLAQYTSISNGTLSFPGLSLGVNAGQTRNLLLTIDPAQNLSAGNTVGFAMTAASDITAVDSSGGAVTPSGTFPIQGNTFTVTSVSNPSIASLTIASSSIGTSVNAGSPQVIVGAWSFTGANSKLWLKGVRFSVVGSANPADIRNVKLLVNGAQLGSTLASVSSNGVAYFDLSASPATLNTGSNSIQLQADIMGSPNRNFQFQILNSYDVLAIDSQYGVPAAASVGSNPSQVTINYGTITTTVSTDTPTGNVARGQSNVTLAKFNIYAAGETVKVKWVGFTLTFTGFSASSSDTQIKNVHLDDDVGNSVGTTISSLETTVTCTTSQVKLSGTGSTTATNCFGSSGSPINYVVPANTTRVLSLKGDIQSAAGFTTVVASLTQEGSNLQGLTSAQTAGTTGASGSALTLASSALAASKNTGIGTQTTAKGANAVKIGSYSLTASSAEGVNVSNLTVQMVAASTTNNFANLRVFVGGMQFGSNWPTLTNSGAYSFSGNMFTVPAGQSAIVDVYADVLSGATAQTIASLTTLTGCSASGILSGTAASCSSTAGQNVVVSSGAALTVGVEAQPYSSQLVMGSPQQELTRFVLTETSRVEDVKISDLNVIDSLGSATAASSTSSVNPSFGNLSLYRGTTLLATVNTAQYATATSSYLYQFHPANPIIVGKGSSVTLVLKGDVASYNDNATDNSLHTFKIATSSETGNTSTSSLVTALGQSSNQTATVTFDSPSGNAHTVLRTSLLVSATPLGIASSRVKGVNDDLGTITFAANSAGEARLNSVAITFGGTAATSTTLGTVDLLEGDVSVMNTSGVASSTSATCDPSTSPCTKTWTFGLTTSGFRVSAGGSRTFKLRLLDSSTNTRAATTGTSVTLSATINARTDVRFTDGSDSTATSGLSLPATAVPVTINSVTYSSGT